VRQIEETIESSCFKRNATDISFVFYQMTHFSENEIFSDTAFIMLELGAVCPEKLARTIGARLLN
jgi:hypothetical protein